MNIQNAERIVQKSSIENESAKRTTIQTIQKRNWFDTRNKNCKTIYVSEEEVSFGLYQK